MPELETLAMCVRVERELALRQVERQARWAVAELASRARRRWLRLRRRPAARVTGVSSTVSAPSRRRRRQPATAGGGQP